MNAENERGRPPEHPLPNHLRQPLSIPMQHLGAASLAADCWVQDDSIWTELRRHADDELERYLNQSDASPAWEQAA